MEINYRTHDELRQLLVENQGKFFVRSLADSHYKLCGRINLDEVEYRVFSELTVRVKNGQMSWQGYEKSDKYRFDAVLFIKPSVGAVGQGTCFTCGIEIKGDHADLMQDTKIIEYVGWTDIFFIGVPRELVEDAIEKRNELVRLYPEEAKYVGVMCLDDGMVYITPTIQKVSLQARYEVLQQVIYGSHLVWGETSGSEVVTLHEADPQDITIPDTTELEENNQQEFVRFIGGEKDVSSSATAAAAMANADVAPGGIRARLSDEEYEEYKRNRANVAAVNAMRKKELAEKAQGLLEDARQRLTPMSISTQELFWYLRQNPCNGAALCTALEMSQRSVDVAVSALAKAGLVERVGSRKTGHYAVTELGRCDESCGICAKYSTCTIRQEATNVQETASEQEDAVSGDENEQ
ncbi:MAG: hypothetical protein J5548_11795 [Prevotella sp.]|nr:hypothetical protein [Prevotella sp.]